MLIHKYFDLLQAKIDEIAADTEPIQKAADICVEALTHGGAIHIYDSGHLVSHELIRRAGGLVAINRLTFSLNVENLVRARPEEAPAKTLSYGYIQHIFDTNQLRKGDVLFVGSVSGKSANVVELAQQARAHGLTVIAVTAMAYSPKLESRHPSGLHLYESADLVLDNHATYGDAMLEVDGLDYPVFPMSGIGATAVLWGVVAGIVESMLARGLKPTVYPSVNRPNGAALVAEVESTVKDKGY
ncbi:MAG: sugar isomerase domain-containing protein [Anaerolineae bacterium]|nr:sugar isomerase domain-containing protein [Anaerolineae bacterium]